MAHPVVSVALFGAVAVLAGVLTVSGLNYTGQTIARVAASAPVKTSLRPGYVSDLPTTRAADLNIATAVVVKPKGIAATAPAVLAATYTHTVAVESLKVRSGPRKTTPQIFALKGGTEVNAIKEDNGWILVDAGKGRIGWVYHKFLRPAGADQLQAEL